ncbi:protein EMBRYO DEFECTIVE 514-like [Macadamia integrifolia]|uniref:protein EMBRYO DEFECTIVE 514-like n=1 Tax=Macadamia integrifolia TaxID=60698 RepID=UPI001C4E7547|nr:protein EMBRYO DEFECTIVE 514-like [Macadamia integrifolia]
MAEGENKTALVPDNQQGIQGEDKTVSEDMDVETNDTLQNPNTYEEHQKNGGEKMDVNDDQSSDNTSNGDLKRARENGGDPEEGDGGLMKQKVETSAEEEGLENLGLNREKEEAQEKEEVDNKSGPVSLGPKSFCSSEEMFNYFNKFLHDWPANLNVNKYEYIVLLDLLKKGHVEVDKKLRGGVNAFQVRYHPMWKSRCFFLIRHDESVDDFSFRKCVDHILPLPDKLKAYYHANKTLGGRGGGGGRSSGGRRGGHGRKR